MVVSSAITRSALSLAASSMKALTDCRRSFAAWRMRFARSGSARSSMRSVLGEVVDMVVYRRLYGGPARRQTAGFLNLFLFLIPTPVLFPRTCVLPSYRALRGLRASTRMPRPRPVPGAGRARPAIHLRYARTQSTAMMPSRLAMTRVASAGGR